MTTDGAMNPPSFSSLRGRIRSASRRMPGMQRAPLCAGLVMLSVLLCSAESAAQSEADKQTAHRLMDDGDRYAEEKRWELALKAYDAAHAIMHVPTTGIEVAKA